MTNDILDVLLKLAPLVNLLAKLEPISASDLPHEHHDDLKQLENRSGPGTSGQLL